MQAARQIRFTSVQEVTKLEKTVKACVREAIEIEQAAFAALTPGRQRAYIFHFSQPKLSTTRAARVEKHIPILEVMRLDN